MVIFECKYCRAKLTVEDSQRVVLCTSCGTEQALPSGLASPDRASRFERANHHRQNGDFDRALEIYNKILDKNADDAEAYWSLLLCRFGVVYVQDAGGYKPTINRMQRTSILADEDYRAACEHADAEQREIYMREAGKINDIQRRYLQIVESERPFDVFICFKDEPKGKAFGQDFYNLLTSRGYRVFFSVATLKSLAGEEYEPYIYAALQSARVMIVIATGAENVNSPWVKNEWKRFLLLMREDKGRLLIPAVSGMRPEELPADFSHLEAVSLNEMTGAAILLERTREALHKAKRSAPDERKPETPKRKSGAAKTVALMAVVAVLAAMGAQTIREGQQKNQPGKQNPPVYSDAAITASPTTMPTEAPIVATETMSKDRFREYYRENYENAESISFLDSNRISVPAEAADISEKQNGGVRAWMDGKTLKIAGPGGVLAPEDCSGLFRLPDTSGDEWQNLMLKSIDFNDNLFDTGNVTGMGWMFFGCSSLTQLDVSGFDTGNVTDMREMFENCSSLTQLDVSGFDTGNVTGMYGMFGYCTNLTQLDVSGFDTGNVTGMSFMFSDCSSLTHLDVSGFDTGNVTDMYGMFNCCTSLTQLDVSGFDTGNVTDMQEMFENCSSLIQLDVSGFDTGNVTDMYGMFDYCTSLTQLDVSGFDTGNVTDMRYMFYNCSSLTQLDVSGFDTKNVEDFFYMFANCPAVTKADVAHFDTSSASDADRMFG